MSPGPARWRTVWITGASTGIGAALARRIMDQGVADYVAVTARSADKLDAMAQSAPAIHSHPADVTQMSAMTQCVEAIDTASGAVDLAVLCAGTWKMAPFETFDVAAARAGMEVNYMGVIHAIQAVLPGMLAKRSGHIAIVASVAGYRGLPLAAAYGPTKAALINLAETMRAELAPHGITVSIVNPGFVDTPMTADNPFPMPGIISADTAAEKLLDGLLAEKYEIVFPRMFGFSVKALRFLPNAVFFWVVKTFIQRKP